MTRGYYVRGARHNLNDDPPYADAVECDYCPDLHWPDEDCPTWDLTLKEAS